ncbi:hypothetical protein [Shimia sp.]|uniref:hypothetical protein n=1 Tax=Shimia sp. TaxID=1954381 RepID=UPI00329A4AAE
MIKTLSSLIILVGGACAAQPFSEWGESGDWVVRVDEASGNGCFMQRSFDSGTMVRIGYVPNEEGAFMSAFNPGWTQIEADDKGSVIFDFGDSRFQGAVVGVIEDDVPGGYAFFNNPEFASEFGRRHSVTIIGEKGGQEELDLAGSSAGLTKLKECQGAQEKPAD